jgi:hypothetical protein
MYMDYMDFTDDAGMHMFTNGQRDRMHTLFAPGGFRYSLLSSNAASVPALAADTPADASSTGGQALSIGLYPNPAQNQLMVQLGDVSSLGSLLEVYDRMGQRVMATRVTGLDLSLDISHLPGGLYYIRLNNGKPGGGHAFVKL